MNRDYLREIGAFMSSKKMAETSIRSYLSMAKKFLTHFKKSPQNITTLEIREYLGSLSYSQCKQSVGSLRILYKHVLNCSDKVRKIKYPKKPQSIPDVLSKDEVFRVIESLQNLKHKAMIQLAYDCGLRVSEVINLKVSDFDKANSQFHIRNSKGAKDRMVPVPERTIELLRRYYVIYKPDEYLFEGQFKPYYSTSSLQTIVRRAISELGITKRIKFHSLRHSKATHLSNAGVSIQLIAKFLGHNSTKTTEIYLHTANEEMIEVIRNAA